jgi:hypothetical protein
MAVPINNILLIWSAASEPTCSLDSTNPDPHREPSTFIGIKIVAPIMLAIIKLRLVNILDKLTSTS